MKDPKDYKTYDLFNQSFEINYAGRSEICLHNSCEYCHGTGTKKNGEICVHFISCPCLNCALQF